MRIEQIYKEIETIASKDRLMEKRYGVISFPDGEPYFTSSQEADILDMISEHMTVEEIINIIKQW